MEQGEGGNKAGTSEGRYEPPTTPPTMAPVLEEEPLELLFVVPLVI
jgi:hypothetical protein